MNIFISAGHTNDRNGANYKKEFFEHSEAVIWRNIICELLGIEPVPIGNLKSKVAYINKYAAKQLSIAIEIHFNAAMRNKKYVGRGCETLHYPRSRKGIKLAGIVHREIVKSFSPDRGLKEGYYRMDPKNKVNYFLARTKCPSIIIEPEFIHRHNLIVQHREICCRNIAEVLKEIKLWVS